MTTIVDGSNGVSFPVGAGGTSATQNASSKVLQVVNSVLNTSTSSTSTSFINLLSLSITPSSTSSKILLTFTGSGAATNSFQVQLVRNSTAIASGTGATNNVTSGFIITAGATSVASYSSTYLDSPATTSAITYYVQAKTDAGTFYINQRNDTFISTITSLVAMEIAQ
jgi:hypothetical protein